jgi:uncharacterized protein YutE (UPF0331/DUF86 family)
MIDPELITRKITLISGDLKQLFRLASMSLTDYLTDPHAEILAERYLERVVGRMIDINYHMITESAEAPPRDYFESFVKMGTLGILPPDLARQIAFCAGLRNRIVHEYDEIDPVRVYEGLQAAVRDIPVYLEAVEKRLPG